MIHFWSNDPFLTRYRFRQPCLKSRKPRLNGPKRSNFGTVHWFLCVQKIETNDSTCQTQTDVPVRTRVEVFARASQTSEIEKYSKKTGTKILVHEMDTQTRSNRNMNENTQTVAVKSDSIGIQTDSGIESAGSDNEGRDQISTRGLPKWPKRTVTEIGHVYRYA